MSENVVSYSPIRTGSLVPSYQEIIVASGKHFGTELVISQTPTRNRGAKLDAQAVAVYLLRAIHEVTYLQAANILWKDTKALHVSCSRVHKELVLKLAVEEIYQNLLNRSVDENELEMAVNKLALGQAIPGRAFIASLIIHKLRAAR